MTRSIIVVIISFIYINMLFSTCCNDAAMIRRIGVRTLYCDGWGEGPRSLNPSPPILTRKNGSQ